MTVTPVGKAQPMQELQARLINEALLKGNKLLELPEGLQSACGRYFAAKPGDDALIFQIMVVVSRGVGFRSFFTVKRSAIKFTVKDEFEVPFVKYIDGGNQTPHGTYEITLSSKDMKDLSCLPAA